MRIRIRMTLAGTVVAALLAALAPASGAVNATQPTLVSANPSDTTPFVKDDPATTTLEKVNAVAVVGNRVIVGGLFHQVKNWQGGAPLLTRNFLFAYDVTTGAVDPTFLPTVDGEVTSLVAGPDGTSVFVGGKFKNVDGVYGGGITKLDAASGQRITTFNMTTNGWVLDMAVRGTKLFLGGTFTVFKATTRTYLGAVDVTTGKIDTNLNVTVADALRNGVSVQKLDVSPAGDRLVMLGNFKTVGGLPRTQLAVIDLTTVPNAVADWNTDGYRAGACSTSPDTYVRDVDISPDGRYFAVVTTGAWRGTSTLCDTAARWELYQTGQAIQPTWVQYTGGDTLTAVAITGTAVYVGGHQRWMNNAIPPQGDTAGPGAVTRNGLAALDPVNGMPYSWNPGRDRGVGVFALLATPNGLLVGHDTDVVGGEYHPKLAYFPLAGGSAVPTVAGATLPVNLYSAHTNDVLDARTYDGARFGAPSPVDTVGWSHVRGAFLINGDLYTGQDDGRLLKRSFDGTTFGAPVDTASWTSASSTYSFSTATGMFFTNGRLYFTKAGDPKLYYRYFEPENGLVGTQLFVASGAGDGLDWSRTAGMTSVAGKIYVADTAGDLRSYIMANGVPVPSSVALIGGRTVDGQNWSATAMFVRSLA